MVAFSLRPHQSRAIDDINKFLAQNPDLDPIVKQPTGSGKSVVIAELSRLCVEAGKRVMVAAHRKELLSQDRAKLEAMAPNVDCGYYSAGLKEKRLDAQVTFAGVQSAASVWDQFGKIDLAIIDEAHLISTSDEGQYATLLRGLRTVNPKIRKVGFTATDYRLDQGRIWGAGTPFHCVCHTTTIQELLDLGYICPVVNRACQSVDLSEVKRLGHDFNKGQLATAFIENAMAASQETVAVANSEGRKKCMVFCVSIQHALTVADMITSLTNERVGVVSSRDCVITASDMGAMAAETTREQTLHDFQHSDLRWLVSVDTLHTGFDCPEVDLISCMRATLSPGLFSQLCGRGLRIAPNKVDCALLDFGGNIARHGSLDDPNYGVNRGQSDGSGEAPMKRCSACEVKCFAGMAVCPNCGFIFPSDDNERHDAKADPNAVVLQGHVTTADHAPKPKKTLRKFTVENMTWHRHNGRKQDDGTKKPNTVRIHFAVRDEETDLVLPQPIKMYYCFDHDEGSFAQKNAAKFWKKISNNFCPASVEEALELERLGATAPVQRIEAEPSGDGGKFWDVKRYVVGELPPAIVFDPEEAWKQLCMFDDSEDPYGLEG